MCSDGKFARAFCDGRLGAAQHRGLIYLFWNELTNELATMVVHNHPSSVV